MDQEEYACEGISPLRRGRNRDALAAAETARPKRSRPALASPAVPPGEKMSLFWQVFGGTIVSVVAVIGITAYNQITSTEIDLRRDVNKVQAEIVRKEELNARLTAQWNSIKDLQRQVEDLNARVHVLSERLATEAAHRRGD